jgi:hypothetical protein
MPEEIGQEFKEINIAVSAEDASLLDGNYVNDLKKVMITGSTVPTYVPKKLVDCYYFYKNGSTKRLYVYVDNAWSYTTLGASSSLYAKGRGTHSAGGGTSNESFTGCGFTPTRVRITTYPSGNYNSSCIGTHTGSTTDCLFNYTNGGTHTAGGDSSSIIVIWDNSLSTNTIANFVSFDADGFTIDWTADSVAVTYLWEAFA